MVWNKESHRHSIASKGIKSKYANTGYHQIGCECSSCEPTKQKDMLYGFDINEVVKQYAIAGLWASYDSDTGEYLDENYSYEDITPETLEKMKEDVKKFIKENAKILKEWGMSGMSESQIGHDFWLSRNGHGAGFFDRTDLCPKELCNKLQESARNFGSVILYVGNDGKIYQDV